MPGKKITDQQVKIYKQMKGPVTQQVAAARAGISIRSARRIDKSQALPSQKKERQWRTRKDPLTAVWEQELEPLLATEPGLQAKTLLEELQRRHGQEAYGDEVLRTLQRRVRAWRALNGGDLETFFAQNTRVRHQMTQVLDLYRGEFYFATTRGLTEYFGSAF